MDERVRDDEYLHRIAEDPRYQALVRLRSRISWSLSILVVAIFFGYILLVAFAGSFLGTPIGSMTTTIGIPIGLFVILSGIGLTAIYVAIANRRFDADAAAILKDHGE